MICAWQEFLNILPESIRKQIDGSTKDMLLELRLRTGRNPETVFMKGSRFLSSIINKEDLAFVINSASRYSPWAAATISKGYITAPGGHRIGICGECVIRDGDIQGIRIPTSLCIRIARDLPGIARKASDLSGNLLILGPPGSGKTTLLRDLIRQFSNQRCGSITVIDENREIFPFCSDRFSFPAGDLTDVLSGCSKEDGLNIAIKTMGPVCIAVDEITSAEDCTALINAHGCGVRILATAHAASVEDLKTRPVYRKLLTEQIFHYALVLKSDKSWKAERVIACT